MPTVKMVNAKKEMYTYEIMFRRKAMTEVCFFKAFALL